MHRKLTQSLVAGTFFVVALSASFHLVEAFGIYEINAGQSADLKWDSYGVLNDCIVDYSSIVVPGESFWWSPGTYKAQIGLRGYSGTELSTPGVYSYDFRCSDDDIATTGKWFEDEAGLYIYPNAPTGLTYSCSGTTANLSWGGVTGANDYRVQVTKPAGEPCASGWSTISSTVCEAYPGGVGTSYAGVSGTNYSWQVWSRKGFLQSRVGTTGSFQCIGVTGSCGAAIYENTPSAPTTNLCNPGTPTWIDQTGADNTFNWTCDGTPCSSNKSSGPVCYVQYYDYDYYDYYYTTTIGGSVSIDSSYGVNGLYCSASDSTPVTCSYDGYSTVTCNVAAPSCGSAHTRSYSTAPTSNLCNYATASWVDSLATDSTYNWNCGSENCYATKLPPGTCGPANNVETLNAPAWSNLCDGGSTPSWVDATAADNEFNWTCSGTSCKAPKYSGPYCKATVGAWYDDGEGGTYWDEWIINFTTSFTLQSWETYVSCNGMNGAPSCTKSGNTVTCDLFPDLVPQAPTVSPASVIQNGNASITGVVRNNGTAVAGAYNVNVFYIDNNNDGIADATTPASRVAVSTGVGATNVTTGNWIATLPPGNNYRVGYFVDTSNEINEGPGGEGNNWSGWSAPFSVTAATVPTGQFTSVATCTIPNGANTCAGSVSWQTDNVPPAESAFAWLFNTQNAGGIEAGSGLNGLNIPTTFYYGSNTLRLITGSPSNTQLDEEVRIIACASGNWNSGTSRCEPTVTTCPANISLSWTVSGNSCNGLSPNGISSGSNGNVTDSIAPTTGSASFACNSGSWSATPNAGASCNAPTANIMICKTSVAFDDPSCYTSGTMPIASTDQIKIRWGSGGNAASCSNTFNGNTAVSGTQNPATAPTPGNSLTYSVVCYDASNNSSAPASVTVQTQAGTPTLTSNKNPVRLNEPFTLTWNTGGVPEETCTLSGPGIATNPLTPTADDPFSGSITISSGIQAQSTYRLNCGGTVIPLTMNIIPISYEE